jgi:WD40 repeat protein
MFMLAVANGRIRSLAFGPNGRALVVLGGTCRGMMLWDLPSQKHKVLGRRLQPQLLAIAPDGRTAATVHGPNAVKVWSLETGRKVAHLAPNRHLSCLTYTGDGKTLLTGAPLPRATLEIRRWDLATQQETQFENCRQPEGRLSMVVADRVLLAGGSWRGEVRVCSPGKRSVKVDLPEHQADARVCFSPDGRTLAILRERTLRLWDVATQQVRASWKETRTINALAFSPDSNILATGGNDGAVKFRDVATGKERASFDWQLGAVSAVAFSPDGMLAAAGGPDGRVVVWDVDQV